jgi:hypothetical protein
MAGFFLFDPLLRSDLAPVGDGAQDNLFTLAKGEILHMRAGKFCALMTARIAPVPCAVSYRTPAAVHEGVIG